jgi:hypothetical protein
MEYMNLPQVLAPNLKEWMKKCKHYFFTFFFKSFLFMMPAEINSRKDSSSLSGSSTANQAAASTPQLSPRPMEMDFVMGGGGILAMDWMTGPGGLLPSSSGAYCLNVTFYCGISFFILIHTTGPIVESNENHSQHVNDWNVPPFPLPLQTTPSVAHHISEPAPFDDLAIIPSSQTQGDTLFLPSDDANPLLAADAQVNYLLLTEAGTDGFGMTALDSFDSFEKTFGSYTY